MLKKFNPFASRLNLILVVAFIVIVAGLAFFFKNISSAKQIQKPLEEVELNFDADGPYALLNPRRDGNALILNIKRVSAYDAISYELTYSSENEDGESVDRGVQGTLNLQDRKNEYSQEILFGTCSKGDTFSTLHCVFDKDVENGTLVLRISDNKAGKMYKMTTTWHLQKPDVALGTLSSPDNHFKYTTTASRQDLATTGFSIINDLTGLPKVPDNKQLLGKVYAFNVPTAKSIAAGEVIMELAENPAPGSKISQYIDSENNWKDLDTKITGSVLTAPASGSGIFAIFKPAN